MTPAPANAADATESAGGAHNNYDGRPANTKKRERLHELHEDLKELAKLDYAETGDSVTKNMGNSVTWRPVTLYRFKDKAAVLLYFGGNEYEGLDGDYTAEKEAGQWVVRDPDGDVVETRPRVVTSHYTLNMHNRWVATQPTRKKHCVGAEVSL